MNSQLTGLKLVTVALAGAITLGVVQAQAQERKVDLPGAVRLAISEGPDVANATTSLTNARANQAAVEGDPGVLITQLTQARNGTELSQTNLRVTRLQVTQNVVTAYLALYEGQENLELLEAQVNLDLRNLEVAKARLAARNGTQLDVARAENALSTTRQNLADARAQVPVLSDRLAPLLGLPTSVNINAAAPPAFRARTINAGALEQGLESRVVSVVQARQALEVAELNVKLADNDYTAPSVLRDAKANLENAKRNLETARKGAGTGLRDAIRAVNNALERVRLAQRDLDNAQEALGQDQVRFKNGTISRLQLQTSEVSLKRSQFAQLQATDNYLRSLAALSVAAGVDVIGLVDPS